MGNSFFNEYPYTDFHELNLSWVIKELRSFATTLDQFVSINALKYADPIQWNITSQYEKNTIVIDSQSGTAYISTQAVPAGVILTDTNYWAVVFDLEQFADEAKHGITANDDGGNTTATQSWTAGTWVWLNDVLYIVTRDITEGNAYVFTGNDANVKQITVEKMNEVIYYPNDKKLSINGKISDYSQIVTQGDYHVYTPNIETISIEHT